MLSGIRALAKYFLSTCPEKKCEVLANRTGCGARRTLRRSASTASSGQRSNAPVMAAKNRIYLWASTSAQVAPQRGFVEEVVAQFGTGEIVAVQHRHQFVEALDQ